MATIGTVCASLTWQQRDPITFLEKLQTSTNKLWGSAWQTRGIMAGITGVILAYIALSRELQWSLLIVYALFPLIVMQILCGVAIMLTHQIQFWLLYTCSPLTLLNVLAWGLAPLTPFGTRLATSVLLPFTIGHFCIDAFTVWVHKQRVENRREHRRHRAQSSDSDPQTPGRWRTIRAIRLITGPWLSIGMLIYLEDPLFALSFLISYWCIATTLVAGIFTLPLVCRTQGQWRTTYVGRTLLLVPQRLIRHLFTPASPVRDQSAMLLALLHHSCLGPAIRRVCAGLPPVHVHNLFFALSLDSNGASAIQYILPAMPAVWQPAGKLYAALAHEATKPLDLQRWLHTLTHLMPDTQTPPATTIATPLHGLELVRDALLTLTYKQDLAQQAEQYLQQLAKKAGIDHTARKIKPPAPSPDARTWITALSLHVMQHHQHLLSVRGT